MKTKKLTKRQQTALEALKDGPLYFKQVYGRKTKGPFRCSDKTKVKGDLKRQDFIGLAHKGCAEHQETQAPMVMTSLSMSGASFRGVEVDTFSLKDASS